MGRTESLNLKNDYERACGWHGHFNKSEMALFSECTDRYAQKLLDTADIVRDVREAIYQQLCSALLVELVELENPNLQSQALLIVAFLHMNPCPECSENSLHRVGSDVFR
jgi:hypothetical protein